MARRALNWKSEAEAELIESHAFGFAAGTGSAIEVGRDRSSS